MVLSDSIVANRGGARNVHTPLKRPCEKALDAQAETDELQALLAQARTHGLAPHTDWLAGVVMGGQAVLRVLQRELQIALEAERAQMERR